MKDQGFPEHDWELLQEKVPIWQEAYIDRVIKGYIQLLSNEATTPSERFRELRRRIQYDRRRTEAALDLRRSMLLPDIAMLLNDGVIGLADLEGFSDKIRAAAKMFVND